MPDGGLAPSSAPSATRDVRRSAPPIGRTGRLGTFFRSLAARIILVTGLTLFLCILILAWFSIRYQQAHAMDELVAGADRLSNTIKLGAHYAMLINSRDDINQIIQNVARQKEIVHVRIYNKDGQIKFSNIAAEMDQRTNIRAEACYVCHKTDPPRVSLDLDERSRVFEGPDGGRLLGILTPIYNEPSCTGGCHVHPPEKAVLGALDVVMTPGDAEKEILVYQRKVILLAALVFLCASAAACYFLARFVRQPIGRLIEGTRRIGRGASFDATGFDRSDEIGELALSIDKMAREIGRKQAELNRQRDEYQRLFAQVPCFITVQNRGFRIMRYNREFGDRFNPAPGDFCYRAYKGRSEKCPDCPVERAFATGLPQCSEESGYNKDGTRAHWLVRATPIFDAEGQVVAAMEMCLDITDRRELEEKLRRSEKEYYAIFNNIPNSVFVLDQETLEVVDCNKTAETVYGYGRREFIGRSFLDVFPPEERERYNSQLRAFTVLNQARNTTKDGRSFFVDINLTPSEHLGRPALLLTTSDVTKRLEAEQKVIQAGKMATLGEMATGVAHELNQPLTVIKTASSFFMKKIGKGERIDDQVLAIMAKEVDSYVDRAVKIINHLREFGRRSDLTLERVQINEVLKSAFDLFSRQLALRAIEVAWELDPELPEVQAMPNRLEQVFVNLLLNARDAIEERCEKEPDAPRRITLRTRRDGSRIAIEVCDTGPGVDKAIQNKIFDPFFTTKKVGKGTGLGLSISYGLIRGFGGSIQVLNRSGGGACFLLTLPLPPGAKPTPPQASDAAQSDKAATDPSVAETSPHPVETPGKPDDSPEDDRS